jgi:hypothetical protein
LLADVDLVGRNDPAIALDTLSILTGVVMIAAGFLRLGAVPAFRANGGDAGSRPSRRTRWHAELMIHHSNQEDR